MHKIWKTAYSKCIDTTSIQEDAQMQRKLSLLTRRFDRQNAIDRTKLKNQMYYQSLQENIEPQSTYFLPKFFVVSILIFLTAVPAFASETKSKQNEVIEVSADAGTVNLNLESRAALLLEPTTGAVLFEHNAHEKLPPASVTKVMTLLLIYDSVAAGKIRWDDLVTISSHAANMGGSQIFLEEGQTQNVKDLTKSISIASANDASVAMAEYIAGSEEGFVTLMNNRAKSLGMENTNFKNACGLDTDGHLTTAYDIALMAAELITKYPEISETALIWMDEITHKTKRGNQTFGLTNTNKMIKSYTGITGLKTGSTSQALFCMAATATKDDLSLVSVILGGPNSKTRFDEAGRLLDHGYANFAIVKGEEPGTPKGIVTVHKGEVEEIELVVASQVNALVSKGDSTELSQELETLESVTAPVEKGTKAGEIIYKQNGREVGRADLIVSEDIPKAGLSHMIRKLFFNWH